MTLTDFVRAFCNTVKSHCTNSLVSRPILFVPTEKAFSFSSIWLIGQRHFFYLCPEYFYYVSMAIWPLFENMTNWIKADPTDQSCGLFKWLRCRLFKTLIFLVIMSCLNHLSLMLVALVSTLKIIFHTLNVMTFARLIRNWVHLDRNWGPTPA